MTDPAQAQAIALFRYVGGGLKARLSGGDDALFGGVDALLRRPAACGSGPGCARGLVGGRRRPWPWTMCGPGGGRTDAGQGYVGVAESRNAPSRALIAPSSARWCS